MKKRLEVLFKQIETYRSEVVDVVKNMTKEEAEIIPNGFNNNIRWNLGHIYLDQYLWIQSLTKKNLEVTEQFNFWFGFGASPNNFTFETPSLDKLLVLLQKQPIKIKEAYSDMLEIEFPPIEMGMCTIEQVLIRTIFHEGLHLQRIIDIKKCINKSF